MLLIFGIKIRFRTIATVAFFCPSCGGDRTGDRQVARRWFTLFWIPVIPLNQVGELVSCTTCGTRYEPDVTDLPTTSSLGQVLTNAVHALTAMVVRTGDPAHPALRAAAVSRVRRIHPDYDDATLTSDVSGIDPALADRYVAPLAENLEVEGKEGLVADLVRVALAAGTVTAHQREVIDRVGRGLHLTPAHVTGIVSSVASASTPLAPPVEPPSDDATPGT